jgi:DNA-binding response OmpR family regulator
MRPPVQPITGRRVLIADPDRATMLARAQYFELVGLQICLCGNLPELQIQLASAAWDVLVIDQQIAGPAVPALFGEIARLSGQPAVIVTAPLMTEVDRIVALELGADHCVSRSCSPAEMLARIRSLLARRRPSASSATTKPTGGTARFADLAFDPGRRLLVRADGSRHRFSAAEGDLLTRFVRQPGRVLQRTELLAHPAEPRDETPGLRAIDVLVSRLRAALAAEEPVIVTVRRRGYMMPHDVRWD